MLSNEIHKSCPIMDFKCSILLKAQIHEISENCEFQWKWVYRIKPVKCYRMKSISPVRLWNLSALYYFNPQIHEKSENCQFQWKWVYRIKPVKCYRMKCIRPVRLWILSALYYSRLKYMKKVKIPNFNESGFIGLSPSNAIEWKPEVLSDYGF